VGELLSLQEVVIKILLGLIHFYRALCAAERAVSSDTVVVDVVRSTANSLTLMQIYLNGILQRRGWVSVAVRQCNCAGIAVSCVPCVTCWGHLFVILELWKWSNSVVARSGVQVVYFSLLFVGSCFWFRPSSLHNLHCPLVMKIRKAILLSVIWVRSETTTSSKQYLGPP
jgi:hypothetical protein